MSFPQLGYPQYLSAAGQAAVYGGGGERPGVLAAAAAAAAVAAGGSGRPAGAELGSSSTAAVTSVLGMYASPYSAPNYSAFLPYTADLSLFSQMGNRLPASGYVQRLSQTFCCASTYRGPSQLYGNNDRWHAFNIYQGFLPLGGSQYELKDNPGVHPATFAAHTAPGFYPYGQFQYGDPGRPKNATRESTSTLKAWLNEHRKNPYPTKGEKIMLAIITKMTLTQVSTWFANARRRLKKENKVTWGARSKEDSNLFGSDNEGENDKNEDDEEIDLESIDIDKIDDNDGEQSNEDDDDKPEHLSDKETLKKDNDVLLAASDSLKSKDSLGKDNSESNNTRIMSPSAQGSLQVPPHNKPKIWSLAETATSPDAALKSSPSPPQTNHTSPPLQHPAFLPSHGLYTCQIGKFHNWTNGAFITQSSLINMRSLLGVNHHHHHHPPHHNIQAHQQAPLPTANLNTINNDKSTERTSPKHTDRENVLRTESPQQLKPSFQPLRENSLAQQEGTGRMLTALPTA